MTGTDLVRRTNEIVATIDSPAFQERVEALLPDTVPYRRFVQIAKTAVRANPDLAKAEQTSLFGALVRCAQDGLYPDGNEAALVSHGNKATYMPMIGGLRKRLAEYGWTLKTRVVYSNDEFDYSEEPQQIRHVPPRPGMDRGERVAAYAVATHRDGRRLQILLNSGDIDARRKKARSQNVWNEWPDAMWEKSAGHAIYDEIPQAERDRMVLPTDNNVESAVELLYGPDGQEFPVTRTGGDAAAVTPSGAESPAASGATPGTGSDGQQEEVVAAPASAATSSPDADDPEPAPAVEETDPAATVVPLERSPWRGKTLAEVSESEEGREWLAWALRNEAKLPTDFYAQLVVFVESKLAAEREAA